ncbi:hypothetical protein AN214_04306 [Pseudoalteromonas sp. P1-9]|uniref:hypothetical protein n=1 Tax=Pseudoalteromonas sp. P1-9 TaxID=1710354 RepID=UPI0006D6301B|nr:hypothetical protein [Pseudoalteromonas sp. P1-9]KPV93660.1 hypothetical protein AN214_04306 [Pseudoalteromonas sp. P1-9]
MDKLLEKILESNLLLMITLGLLALIAIMIVILFIQYQIDRAKGKHAKFLWFEVNATQPQASETIPPPQPTITGKNINTGNNHGQIGDQYTGLKQREFTQSDAEYLKQEIEKFSVKYADKINRSHMTIGLPGCKETTNLANQVAGVLKQLGYNNLQIMTLQTWGVIGKKFGVSNAPDNTIMVEIYPPDNVE